MTQSSAHVPSSTLTGLLASSFDERELMDLLGLMTGAAPIGLELGLEDLADRLANVLASPGILDAIGAMPLDEQQTALVARLAALNPTTPPQVGSVTAPGPGLFDPGQASDTEPEAPVDDPELDTAPRLRDREEDTAPRLRDPEQDTQPELAHKREATDPNLLVIPVIGEADGRREITDVGIPIHEFPPEADPVERTGRGTASKEPPSPSKVRLYTLALVAELLLCVWFCMGIVGGNDDPEPDILPMVPEQGPATTLGELRQGSPAAGDASSSTMLGDISPSSGPKAPTAALAARPRGQPTGRLHIAVPEQVDMRFIGLTAGEFTMGAGDADTFATAHERPAHRVAVAAFWMAEKEVSVAQWYALQGKAVPINVNPRNAMGGVSWCDTVRYANLLSRADGFLPFYTDTDSCESAQGVALTEHGDGYRLPTEAEWEYAARAGRLDAPSEPIPCLRSQFSSSSTGNIWKFKGLNGVVWEWVWDVKASYTSQPRVDTVWPTPGRERVLRGGSFASPDLECAFTARNAAGLESRTEDLGFRLARTE